MKGAVETRPRRTSARRDAAGPPIPERDKFLEAIAEDAAATIRDRGCLQFDVLVLANDPNHLFLYEVYESEAAFRAHRGSDYFKKYAATTANMVAKRVTRAMTAISSAQKDR